MRSHVVGSSVELDDQRERASAVRSTDQAAPVAPLPPLRISPKVGRHHVSVAHELLGLVERAATRGQLFERDLCRQDDG